jgi:hypothetical protein
MKEEGVFKAKPSTRWTLSTTASDADLGDEFRL